MLNSLVGPAARVVIKFADADTRQTITVRQPDGRDEEQYLFGAADNICGTVSMREVLAASRRKDEHCARAHAPLPLSFQCLMPRAG